MMAQIASGGGTGACGVIRGGWGEQGGSVHVSEGA